MLVSEIMTTKPVTLKQHQTLRDALELMDTNHFHHLPIMNNEGQLVGIITKRDCRAALNIPTLQRASWQTREQIINLPVRMLMTPAPIVIEPTANAEEAARLMLTHHVSCLPVVRSETLVGILTTSDILIAFRMLYRRWMDFHDNGYSNTSESAPHASPYDEESSER